MPRTYSPIVLSPIRKTRGEGPGSDSSHCSQDLFEAAQALAGTLESPFAIPHGAEVAHLAIRRVAWKPKQLNRAFVRVRRIYVRARRTRSSPVESLCQSQLEYNESESDPRASLIAPNFQWRVQARQLACGSCALCR